MKYGMRKPSLKKSVKARTTGRVTRASKKLVNPIYGKKGAGNLHPKKKLYNKVYNKTTTGMSDLFKEDNKDFYNQNKNSSKKSNETNASDVIIGTIIAFLILFCINNHILIIPTIIVTLITLIIYKLKK